MGFSSLFSELYETERIVKSAEFDYSSASISKYRKPTPFEARSSIRERALKLALDRVGSPQFAKALEAEPEPGLSPELRKLYFQRLALRQGAGRRISQQLELIRQQDIAADTEERAFKRLSPLQQARTRDGWYRRSTLDRNAAILGTLQRERRSSSPLTREAWSRAKTIAASRGMTSPYVVSDADLERAAAGPLTSARYEAYKLEEKNRRETLFAKSQVVAGGYPGPRGPSRAEILKQGC